VGNRVSPITIVGAITSTLKKPYPFQVFVPAGTGGLEIDSVVTLNHIRSIDRRRLVRRLGALSDDLMRQVDEALIISLDIDV
jgi:mRNA interferase MazF